MTTAIQASEGTRFNDRNVNQGFPAGTSYKDLKPGRWALIRWNDSDDTWGVILEHDERPHNFKGDRSIKVLIHGEEDGQWSVAKCTQEQIVRFGNMLDRTLLNSVE